MPKVADAIPLVDLRAAHREVEAEIREGLERTMANTAFILGDEVEGFEREYAAFIGTEHCIGVSNGTDALELVLRALGIGPGDEVIVPANTFAATALSVIRAEARPVFVDCDDQYLLMDPERLSARITPRTKAIVPVHLYGQVAAMEEIMPLAEAAGVPIVEDAAQVQGARRNGRSAGTFGRAASTSFYPGKNLGAYGDAGAIVTDEEDLARRLRALRNYGSPKKYDHPIIGFNCRLDSMQAVVLRVKLKVLERWNSERREAAARYDALLAGEERVRIVPCMPGNEHIYHVYAIRVASRGQVHDRMQAAEVGVGIHYPDALHQLGAFSSYVDGTPFPAAEKAASELLSLPIYPQITAAQQERVVEELIEALD